MQVISPSIEIVKPLKGPRLSVQNESFALDTKAIRCLDWDRSRFDIEFGLRNGTTYNSFIIRGEKIAVVDTSHEKFERLWIDIISAEVSPSEIDYLIVSHTEPDHSGLIRPLLDLNPNIIIVGSKVALKFLEDQVHKEFKSLAVKTGDELDLGINTTSKTHHCLNFISAPNLHWPDTIFSFDMGSGTLFTCDAFGLHYCSDDLYDSNVDAISQDFRFYYDCLMGPNARSVIQALKKVDKLTNLNTIAVGHGPLLKDNVNHWIQNYKDWSNEKNIGENYVAVCYISQYGYCDRLSQSLAHGIHKANGQAQLVDLQASDPQELSALISESSVVILPTWPSQPNHDLQSSIGTLFASLTKKQQIVLYDAFGGNDEPIDVISSNLKDLGNREALPPLKIRDTPDSYIYQKFEEAGTDLGQSLNRKKNIANKKGINNELAKAMGRLSGGLYIVTASQEDENSERSSAMVASWVSQASFNPPGITVAVAKDRAIESLMQVGDDFVINILEEDNYMHLFRHFLKRFPPGSNRFENIETLNIAKGGPVFADSLAFLSCNVQKRLETEDHWIIYAVVEQGNVANAEGKTAVHHRRVGTNY